MSPSISAICLRAGWTQGAIKDKYLKYEHAADTYLGRVLAGMPTTSKDIVHFGDLPPTWGKNIADADVQAALKVAFPCTQDPRFPASSLGVFNRMLAVIVKNHFWLENRQFVMFLEGNIRENWPDEERGYRIPPPRRDVGKMHEHACLILGQCLPTSEVPAAKRRKTSNQKGWTTHLNQLRKWKRECGIAGALSNVIVRVDDA